MQKGVLKMRRFTLLVVSFYLVAAVYLAIGTALNMPNHIFHLVPLSSDFVIAAMSAIYCCVQLLRYVTRGEYKLLGRGLTATAWGFSLATILVFVGMIGTFPVQRHINCGLHSMNPACSSQ